MKKLFVTLAVAITGAVQAFALTPTAIRENARFLTDRMAYELNLTPQQIEDCYEINYDFIASINPIMDEVVYGYPEYIDRYYNYLDYRNDDLRYIMTEAQYLAFISLDYFFRPVYTYAGNWLFRIFDIYTNHRFFYYDAPLIYHSYYGGHGRHYFPHGYYGGGRYHHHMYAHQRPIHRRGGRHDFGPHAARPRPHATPRHTPSAPRHERMDHGRNDNHRGNDGINHRGGGNDNHRGNPGGGASQGGGNGRGNDHGNRGGASQGGSNNRASHAQSNNSGRQMRQQASGRTERVQGSVMRGTSGTTRAASSSRISSGSSHRGGGTSHSGGSHGGGSRGGSRGGGSNGGGHQRR